VAGLKGTETLITPATCPFTNRSLFRSDHARPQGLESMPETPFKSPVLESQALKSWMASLAADPT
jgi:hypothetical protein